MVRWGNYSSLFDCPVVASLVKQHEISLDSNAGGFYSFGLFGSMASHGGSGFLFCGLLARQARVGRKKNKFETVMITGGDFRC